MKKRKVLAITGIRSEYDILFPVIDRIRKDEHFELEVVVSSAHLSDFHGYTLQRIEEDGFKIADKLDTLFNTNRETQRSKGTGMLIYALSQTVERIKPDFLIVVGDREESIATCIVGNYMNIMTVHIGGGDPVFGNADDPVRVACSKLAHIHFTTTRQYANNLIEHLYEDNFRVFFSGNPALENILFTPFIDLDTLSNRLEINIRDGKYIVLVNHPLSSEVGEAASQMKITLDAIDFFAKNNGYKIIASYPNTDPGSYDIIKIIKEYEFLPYFKFNKTLPKIEFVNLMRNAKALIGNSSMGILEAPTYKLPVVNVGNRQKGRLQAGNVEFVGHNKEEILNALERACTDEKYRSKIKQLTSPYENGEASLIICNELKKIDPQDEKFLIKKKLC
jgi:GDP/UDP-N,N'-diacetylbacillosamine 2-epimerase (hydrolysing)